MKIVDVICSKGKTGFYFDDRKSIISGARFDGFTYIGEPIIEGFSKIRQAGESISILIILEDGQVAYGDCAAVQYSGAGGRDPLFLAKDFVPFIEKKVLPHIIGKDITTFRKMAQYIDNLVIDGKRLHSAIRYGITQGILDAVAKTRKITMARVIKEEYSIDTEFNRIPIFAQSGDERYTNVDKMILKGVEVLPHGLINNIEDKLGQDGGILKDYIIWLNNRVRELKIDENYNPTLHIDVYGTIGIAFNYDLERISNYLGELEKIASPLRLRIEGPIDAGSRVEQLKMLKNLKDKLKHKGINVEIVADEWCNTLEDVKLFADERAVDMIQIKTPDLGGINNIVEAILYCKSRGVGAYCGGTCNETDRSAQICTHIAIACGADQCLAKPGMGVDEGYMIVNNEMERVLALWSIGR